MDKLTELISNLQNLKTYIDYLIDEKITKEDGKKLIDSCDKLKPLDKNFIYLYCYPRPLLDRELPNRINNTQDFNKKVLLLLEASRTEQYSRYIQHLCHSFLDNEGISIVKIVKDIDDNDYCPICGKKLENEKTFGSKDSSSMLCEDCLKAIIVIKNILEIINPEFLDWTKRYTKNNNKEKVDWNKLRGL